MTMQTAFAINSEDIALVLSQSYFESGTDTGKSLEELALEIFDAIEPSSLHRFSAAALQAGVDLNEQTDAAHAEIRRYLINRGNLPVAHGA